MTEEELKEEGKENLDSKEQTVPDPKSETEGEASKKKEDPKPTTSPEGAGEVIKPIGGEEKNPKKM